MCVEKKEIIEILDHKLAVVSAETNGLFDVINTKLDNIQIQTTKTNSRVTSIEDKTVETDIRYAKRLETCPYSEDIRTIKTEHVKIKELKVFLIKAVTIAGIFFTILFGLIRSIVDGGISNMFNI